MKYLKTYELFGFKNKKKPLFNSNFNILDYKEIIQDLSLSLSDRGFGIAVDKIRDFDILTTSNRLNILFLNKNYHTFKVNDVREDLEFIINYLMSIDSNVSVNSISVASDAYDGIHNPVPRKPNDYVVNKYKALSNIPNISCFFIKIYFN